jgi:U3 small nucleolar RNA-associated protein 19
LNHQLEYPQFYPSLYKLLHPRILYTKHRTRFLRLLSKSLESNSMLPAYVVAAFCKKLLRLGLSGPPSGALFVLALVSNLIRKHGEVGCLIHRMGNEEGGWMEDVFAEDAEELIQTRGEVNAFIEYQHLCLPINILFTSLCMHLCYSSRIFTMGTHRPTKALPSSHLW